MTVAEPLQVPPLAAPLIFIVICWPAWPGIAIPSLAATVTGLPP
jgi:hypothetical protein